MTRPWRPAASAGFVLAGLAAGFLIASIVRGPVNEPARPVTRLAIPMPGAARLTSTGAPGVAISPDGRRVAFAVSEGGVRRIYVRELGASDAQPLVGTEGGYYPFFSPDGQWLGFLAERRLKKIALSGGAPVTLTNLGGGIFGAAWSDQGTIAFAPRFDGALLQVSSEGGATRELTRLDAQQGDVGHHWPQWLPGGKAIIFTDIGGDASWDDATIVVQSLDTGERRILIKGGTYARYSPSGHLIYLRAGTMMAVPFDLARLEVRGSPTPVVHDVLESVIGAGHFDVTATGDLAYVHDAVTGENPRPAMSWVDRQGVSRPLKIDQQPYLLPRVSPDGRRLAVWIPAGARCAVAVYDLEKESWTRLTFAGDNHTPVWTPDGRWVAYQTSTGGPYEIFIKPSDGSGTARPLTQSGQMALPNSWTPDGRTLVYTQFQPGTGWDIWSLPMAQGLGAAPSDKPRVFVQTPANELMAALSPDGRWLAYVSDDTGRSEVLVRSFPDGGGPWQVSVDGGSEPVWSRDGTELFYSRGVRILAVPVSTTPTFSAGKAVALFDSFNDVSAEVWSTNYDVTRDGRFVMPTTSRNPAAAPTHVSIVLNWFQELKARLK